MVIQEVKDIVSELQVKDKYIGILRCFLCSFWTFELTSRFA